VSCHFDMCCVTSLCVVPTRPWEVSLCVMSLCMCYVIGRYDYVSCHFGMCCANSPLESVTVCHVTVYLLCHWEVRLCIMSLRYVSCHFVVCCANSPLGSVTVCHVTLYVLYHWEVRLCVISLCICCVIWGCDYEPCHFVFVVSLGGVTMSHVTSPLGGVTMCHVTLVCVMSPLYMSWYLSLCHNTSHSITPLMT